MNDHEKNHMKMKKEVGDFHMSFRISFHISMSQPKILEVRFNRPLGQGEAILLLNIHFNSFASITNNDDYSSRFIHECLRIIQ